MQHKVYTNKQAEQFHKTFGVALKSYFDPVFGFDIVRFDDEVVKSGDKQMSATVTEKWGFEATKLVVALNTL